MNMFPFSSTIMPVLSGDKVPLKNIKCIYVNQEKERARDLEQASSFCENLCNDFVSIASSSESAGQPNAVYFTVQKFVKNLRIQGIVS
jgi:hypothetical protein